MQAPKFIGRKSDFHTQLKTRVQAYFNSENIAATGNRHLYTKAILFCVFYLFIYVHLIFFTPSVWIAIPECIVFGLVTAAIGFNIMHDGAHGSFSKRKIMNRMAGYSLNFLGGSTIMWNMKHNVIHHTYTNIDGVDDDMEAAPWLRMASTQKKLRFHKFQHYYFWFFYALLHLLWIFVSDYQKYFSGKIGDIKLRKMTLKEHFTFWAAKIIYAFMFIALPIMLVGFSKWLVGFLIITMSTGFVISIIFQLAHTVEHTSFPLPDKDSGKMESEWAIHQLNTTSNFATENKLISWLVGGLNFQIEHHLFPKISHVHYPALSKIIKETCREYGIPYLEYKKMRHAVYSHIMYLKQLAQAA